MIAADWIPNLAVVRQRGQAPRVETRGHGPPAAGEVTFGIQRAAVCGTDLQILRGDRPDGAAILGHEGFARVVNVGSAVRDYAVGDQVVFNPVNPRDQDEILGHSTDGLFQQFATLPLAELARRALVERLLPSDDERSVLAEPLGTVVYSHEVMATLRAPRSLLVLGAGPIGILHALYAQRRLGLPRVQMVCRSTRRARWLQDRNLMRAGDLVDDVAAITTPVDAVVLCTPARATAAVIEAALRIVADDGWIGLVAGLAQPLVAALPGVDLVQLRRANVCGQARPATVCTVARSGVRVHLFGHRGSAPRHLHSALAALRDDAFWSGIFTHRISLASLPGALADVAADGTLAGTEYVKGLIDCTSPHAGIEPMAGTP